MVRVGDNRVPGRLRMAALLELANRGAPALCAAGQEPRVSDPEVHEEHLEEAAERIHSGWHCFEGDRWMF